MAKIVGIREFTAIKPNGEFEKRYEITYEIEGIGQFTLEIPKKEFSALTVQQIINQEEAEIRKLMGRP